MAATRDNVYGHRDGLRQAPERKNRRRRVQRNYGAEKLVPIWLDLMTILKFSRTFGTACQKIATSCPGYFSNTRRRHSPS